MGVKGPELDDDEFVQFYDSRNGTYKNVVVRDGKLIGATLMGEVGKAGMLTQAFDGKIELPEERLSLLFDLAAGGAAASVADLADDTQVCNCNGVSKGDIVSCVHAGAPRSARSSRRRGQERAAAPARGSSPTSSPARRAAHWCRIRPPTGTSPCIPMTKAELIAAIREQDLRAVSQVFAALAADGAEDAGSKMPLASLLRTIWGPDWVDERGALFINDRVHANIQRDGTFSVVPQMKGGVTTPDQLRRIADVADKYQRAAGEGHRRPAHRPARDPQGGPAQGVG